MPDSIDPLPPDFFANMGRPPAPTANEAKAAKVHPIEMVKDPVEGAVTKEQS